MIDLNPKVIGILDKIWGKGMCAHGHEDVTPIHNYPSIETILGKK